MLKTHRSAISRLKLSWGMIAAFVVGAVSASLITALELLVSPWSPMVTS